MKVDQTETHESVNFFCYKNQKSPILFFDGGACQHFLVRFLCVELQQRLFHHFYDDGDDDDDDVDDDGDDDGVADNSI